MPLDDVQLSRTLGRIEAKLDAVSDAVSDYRDDLKDLREDHEDYKQRTRVEIQSLKNRINYWSGGLAAALGILVFFKGAILSALDMGAG